MWIQTNHVLDNGFLFTAARGDKLIVGGDVAFAKLLWSLIIIPDQFSVPG